MLSGNCTKALSIQANVTISGSSAKLIKNDIAPLPFPPRAAKAILVHQARGEGQGEGTCSILCNVMLYLKDDPTKVVVVLAIAILLCVGLWRLIRWLFSGHPPPDPWSEEVAAEIAKDDAVPLCHRCLAPHDSQVDFCPECGAPVGSYTNWLPYPCLFSIGHTLRIGSSGDFRRSPLTIAGFFC